LRRPAHTELLIGRLGEQHWNLLRAAAIRSSHANNLHRRRPHKLVHVQRRGCSSSSRPLLDNNDWPRPAGHLVPPAFHGHGHGRAESWVGTRARWDNSRLIFSCDLWANY
jgi:hypothetical protein